MQRTDEHEENIMTTTQTAANVCTEAWPTGISVGLDRPCARAVKHTSWHRDATGDLSWSGRMTDDDRDALDLLRDGREPNPK